MVVSKAKAKDTKKRKQSPPPPQPSAVESSPEMPKRTKVQAQRKFAQGQNAPTSSYNAIIAASSSSNTGPSTSSESREPPTEILPNKRPKTEDFLTFLCFRGTPALPAHLDFLNQGKAKETESSTVKKNIPKPAKITKKGKKGRPSKAAVAAAAAAAATKKEEPTPSTSKDITANAALSDKKEVVATAATTVVSEEQTDTATNEENAVISFAVRKRAELVTDGNRRGRAIRNTSEVEKCNNATETKRRSIRTKDNKSLMEAETDEDDEYFSANDETGKVDEADKSADAKNDPKTVKTPLSMERKSETPSKESETGKSRKGRPSSTAKKAKDVLKENTIEVNKAKESLKPLHKVEKQPVKRPRQKESPIFIPSPEPSGRMTRQRAFFEPVKVPHRDEIEEEGNSAEATTNKLENSKTETELKSDIEDSETKVSKTSIVKNESKMDKVDNINHTAVSEKVQPNMNVFDFSSDDEQPLAKSIKLKKGKAAGTKKANKTVGRKSTVKKIIEKKEELPDKTPNEEEVKENENKPEITAPEDTLKTEVKEEKQDDGGNKNKNKRGKNLKKKIQDDEQTEDDKDKLVPTSPKKSTNAKQPRKKTKAESTEVINGEDDTDTSPVRSQRPTRKTKEAATIYMGIIGHKLQLADDEEDDLSLNSFPDRPNVKEMEKMEFELKKNASHTTATTASTKVRNASPMTAPSKSPPKQSAAQSPLTVEKQATGRRGRPPKQTKQVSPVKREIEGMLVKKGAITKIAPAAVVGVETVQTKEQFKVESEDEDFLLNEEVNETKRKLEKSFSDSDDEPLAIKVNVKTGEKELEPDSRTQSDVLLPPNASTPPTTTALTMLTLPTKLVHTPPPMTAMIASQNTNASPPITTPQPPIATSQTPSPFKSIEKKSPVPTSKILNVPATYATPNVNVAIAGNFSKSSSYLPQSSPHYHASHVRPPNAHQFPTAKSPTTPAPATPTAHLTAPLPPQSPIKYQTPPTTYPPPIEAYPSPKINPNFLTPKFDRASLPRSNNFPSPSPVKFDIPTSATSKTGIIPNSLLSVKTSSLNATAAGVSATVTLSASVANVATTSASNTMAVTTPTAANNSSDPLKDEIGSILAANLMPSKEESGKIFGIASVSLAQSSGPDNTKCTLGKCGSIHKPVLGPVVPTEGYIGDQLSSKERRKAKVNMTHEQIQKWLIECSSNPDEIQDDLDDDFDDNLRPNLFATTPPPTRDDKESTSFSSSSKATRDLGKSESAWSAKGPSLKATPVVATSNRKEESKQLDTSNQIMEVTSEHEKTSTHAINLTQKTGIKQTTTNVTLNEMKSSSKEKPERRSDKKPKEDKTAAREVASKDNKQSKIDKERETTQTNNAKTNAASKQSNTTANQNKVSTPEPTTTTKQSKKKNSASAPTSAVEEKTTTSNEEKSATNANTNSGNNTPTSKTPKRTPVYNQKAQKLIELKETTTTSHKRTAPFSYGGAFSADNEKSIYSFDKDDDGEVDGSKPLSKPAFRRQSRRDSQLEETITTPTTRASPAKKRAAASAAEKANKDVTNPSQNSSVSLTLSPSENCKLVKVSLDAEKAVTSKAGTGKSAKAAKKAAAAEVPVANDADSDSDGHTFYIPLQGSGVGGEGDGGIQGVAVKLGREGPDGPNQKVIMHATLVTKAQMGSNSKPLPDSMNVSDIVKTLMTSTSSPSTNVTTNETSKKSKTAQSANITPSTSAAAAAAALNSANSTSNSLKSVPIGTVQPRFKASDAAQAQAQTQTQTAVPTASTATGNAGGSGLVRVNSNSSLFSGSAKSRIGVPGPGPSTHNANKKFKDDTPIKMANNTAFPRHDDPTQMVEAPIFRPTEKEFSDPIEFIERITPIAARFGICKIIPPATFKPECRISDEMRFTAYNQYVHKMLHRWGPSAKELSAIKKYLTTQSIVMNHPPWIGGMEVDLPRLYHTVQELGGLKEVIEKKKWARVAEEMCIPKLAQDRVTKLDDIYCKYLLPYDTLSPSERQKLFDEVEADWAKREARARRNADRFVNTESVSNEEDDVSSEDDEESEEEVDGVSMECIVKGRSMPLSQFYRIARNTMALWFKNTEPTVNEVEAEFWRHVAVRDSHVCVHSGSIDSSGWGYGFPSPGPKSKGSNYARHPWNLKVLTNNPGSVLRSLGPVMGVTVPTLHVGMLFSACCWYRDPHGLSWIEYLHTGASKLWYGIPDDQSANFRAALTSLIPTHCQNKTIWLPCDTVMVPPHMLTDRGVSLCRIEQKPGEFIVVFPRAYTSSLATGYVVSESVYFATTSWLDLAKDDFRDIHDSCEPAMFSLEQLLFALGYDQRVTIDTLQQMQPMLNEVFEKETAAREQLKAAGVTSTEKVHNEKGAKAKKQQPPFKSIESECDLCRANLYISMVKTEDGNVYCLQHALKNLNNGNIQAKQCKLIYAYNVEDIENLIKNLKDKIQQKRHGVVNKKQLK